MSWAVEYFLIDYGVVCVGIGGTMLDSLFFDIVFDSLVRLAFCFVDGVYEQCLLDCP